MKRLLIALILLTPFAVNASADPYILQSDIRFSEEVLVSGDNVRIYTSVYNSGDEDVSGYVTFYQGSTLIGDSQVISVISGGNPEDVYVDFIVPSSSFNIMAQIKGTDPSDSDLSNNTAITKSFDPIQDDDRDGIENSVDNCPSKSNSSQLNTDGDDYGDACDNDDDNDGLSDSTENELGTSTTSSDTDGDGVSDKDDAYPLDVTRSVIEPEPVLVEVVEDEPEEVSEKPTEAIKAIIAELKSNAIKEDQPVPELYVDSGEDEKTDEEIQEQDIVEISELKISPNALFSYERTSWNTYNFIILGPQIDSGVYVWDFDDDSTSSKSPIEHTFNNAGAYTVSLTMTDSTGAVSTETAVIYIPLFSLNNAVIITAITALTALLIAGLVSLAVLMKKSKKN